MVKKFWPVAFVVVFLLFVSILAITQEADEESVLDELPLDDMVADLPEEEGEDELPSVWQPLGPPRWFRSNAGGMAVEEIPSRLAALHHKYALVVDYAPPAEIEPRLLPYYHHEYSVEIRVLYEQGVEIRRQWLFRDELGAVRLNAVFLTPVAPRLSIELTDEITEINDEPEPPPASINRDMVVSTGFLEIFNETSHITEERQFFDDNSETLIFYSYNTNILVKAEAQEKMAGGELHTVFIDYYRYNRSYSLRHVERQFFDASDRQPVRLLFPGRVLDAAYDQNFIGDKLAVTSDFFGASSPGEGYRIIYHTDNRGRILSQTLLNSKDEEVWVIVNTWSGDRIVAMQKTEGEDVKVTEYEYDGNGDRVVQRDIHNGVLERLVRANGENETEELYMDGNLVLKAYWVNGRKVSEERVRRR